VSAQPDESEQQAPRFHVVGGSPDAEELAALSVVLACLRRERGRPHAPGGHLVASGWKSYWANVRQSFVPGRDAWRASIRR